MSLFPRICTRSMAISKSSGSLHIHRQSRRNTSGGRVSGQHLTRRHIARLSTLAVILSTHEEYLCTLAHKENFYVHKGTLATHYRFILAPRTPSGQNFRSFGTSVQQQATKDQNPIHCIQPPFALENLKGLQL